MGEVPARIRWAVELVDPRPADALLEIGCGPGVAAALICDRLTDGRMLAVDRSTVAVERTTRRNAVHLRTGRLTVRQEALATLRVPPGEFDKAFSINVNLFWTADCSAELRVVHAALRPGGGLYVVFDPQVPAGAARITEPVTAALLGAGFVDVRSVSGPGGLGVLGHRRCSDGTRTCYAPGASGRCR